MKRRLPPLNALRAFESAARLGRMTAAAEELCVTPGAISRQVRQLELALDQRLFEGPKNKPQLTAAAKRLLPVLSSAFDQMEAGLRAVGQDDGASLDVSCFSTFTMKWLIPRLYHFHLLHPDIHIRLSAAEHPADVARGRHDLVISVDAQNLEDVPAPAGLLPLFPERLGPVMAPALAARLALRRPESVAAQPLMRTRTRPDAWRMWCQALGCDLPEPEAGPAFEHYYFTLEAAVAGLGICIAPWHLVMDDVHAGRLVAPLGFQESGYRYVARRRLAPNRRLDLFCDWLQAQALQTPAPSQRP